MDLTGPYSRQFSAKRRTWEETQPWGEGVSLIVVCYGQVTGRITGQ